MVVRGGVGLGGSHRFKIHCRYHPPPQSHKHDTTSNFITTHTDVGPIHKDNRSDHQEKGIWMKGVGDSVCIHREINLGGWVGV